MTIEPTKDIQAEDARLAALDRYDVLDTPAEDAFDRITRLACRIFNVPMSTVTFVDGHRQWFKSRQGREDTESDRGPALCRLVVEQGRPLIVENALDDARVRDNPYVTGDAGIRFYAGVPLQSSDGQQIGTLCALDTKPHTFDERDREMLTDLARVVMDELELRMLATTDALTGALSRRAFHDEAAKAVALALRHRYDVSLVMFDIDHFKRVNDTHGHAAGDAVLRELAATCRANLRVSDIFGRLGGEEFGLLLPHTASEAALETSEKLRSLIAHMRVSAGNETVQFTASFGICGMGRHASSLDELMRQADAALYEAKRDGRNRCKITRPAADPVPAPDQRRRVLKAGRITFNAGHSTIDCTIRSLSDKGAGIDVLSTSGVPERFKLHIFVDDTHRACHVTARSERHVEVDFV